MSIALPTYSYSSRQIINSEIEANVLVAQSIKNMPQKTLYVTGFSKESKAADLAPDFEKYV